MAVPTELDCLRCGACCRNPPENVAEGYRDYIQVEAGDRILQKPDLVRRYVVENDEGLPHLRLDPEGRCLALRGSLGRKVWCAMYHDRPSPCRRVALGSELCLRYRAAMTQPVTKGQSRSR
jgi:Fe-S-cluster containining protein